MTLPLFLPSRWQLSIKVGSMVQPILWKISSTFVSKFLSSTCRGIPAISKHSLLEYWAFAQQLTFHCHNSFTKLTLYTLSNNSLSLNFSKTIIKLTHFLKHGVVIHSYFILQWQNDRTIGMSSLFSILSKASFVYCDMVNIVARWRLGWKI